MKAREIDALVNEHDRIVEVVGQEWRGEVEEARGQVEELRDVSFKILYIQALMTLNCLLAEHKKESKELRSEHLRARDEHERPAREIRRACGAGVG